MWTPGVDSVVVVGEQACPICGLASGGGDSCKACGRRLRLADAYEITGMLDVGGTSRVMSARRLADDAQVAVKVHDLRERADWKAYDLFERGTAVLLRLSHPGLPKVYALERDEAGRLYQIRERFDGGTLADRAAANGEPPSAAIVATLLRDLLSVLRYLHERVPPIVHRDIKPSNIMFRRQDSWKPVLIDFESVAQAHASTGTTIVVSPGYTAPEQLGGRVTPVSDLYSLAATFAWLCSGRDPDELLRDETARSSLFASLDERTRHVLLGMLEPIPEQSVPSASRALEMLSDPATGIVKHRGLARLGQSRSAMVGYFAVATLCILLLVLGARAREHRFEEAVAGLGFDFGRTTDRVVVQSAKGVAVDMGMDISECTVKRHYLTGQDAGSLQHQLEAIPGLSLRRSREPAAGDAFVVLECNVAAYPILSVLSRRLTLTFRTGYGVSVN